jgi:hypothetical protein
MAAKLRPSSLRSAPHGIGERLCSLSTIGELQSLVDYSQAPSTGGSPGMIEPTYFPGTPGFPFWSSTPVAASNGGSAWAVQFADGSTEGSSSYVDNGWDIRCVR